MKKATPINKDIPELAYDRIYKQAIQRQEAFLSVPGPRIHIGTATCGIAAGALETRSAFEEALTQRNIDAQIHTVGCFGHCYAEPVVIIDHPDSA